MFFKIEQLHDLPVILATWYEGFKFLEHGPAYEVELNAHFRQLKAPAFYILDLSDLHSISLDGLIAATNAGASGDFRDAMNRGSCFISSQALIKLTAQGMDSDSFGHLNIRVYGSIDEALDYVRSQV